jgi:hypothetical protein
MMGILVRISRAGSSETGKQEIKGVSDEIQE